jgi:beta-xylosidase
VLTERRRPVDCRRRVARLSLTVTNTGRRRGTEVVQLYAADTATGLTLPAQQLVGFARVDLEPSASKTITLSSTACN